MTPPRHLYVHVPFCARRCVYCDFSIAVRNVVPVERYVAAIRRELAQLTSALEPNEPWQLSTLYLGGGTPSRLGAEGVQQLFSVIRSFVELDSDAEVTLEANPEDVTTHAADAWRAAGINRLSLGAQSFHDNVLEWMHRVHSASTTREAVHNSKSAGIGNISLDLIFSLPDALQRDWNRDLDEALELEPQHISLYGLTVEPGTALKHWIDQQRTSVPTEDNYANEFLLAHEKMTEAGFRHYEVSNFALPGREARHNSAYWTQAPYIGIGPSAHSFDGERRSWNVAPYSEWLRQLESGDSPRADEELLATENRLSEKVYLGLRTSAGLAVSASDKVIAERWANAGWAVIEGDLVRLNAEGWLRLDSLAAGLTGS